MKKVVLLIVILGWMELGCCQSQCNGSRCMIVKQARAQKVESKSIRQVDSQTSADNYLSSQSNGQNRVQNPSPPSLIP